MRTIKHVALAFAAGEGARGRYFASTGQSYLLHGSRIAWHNPDGTIWASFCGYHTPSTLNHLKAIARVVGSPLRFGYSTKTRPATDPFQLV